MADEFSYETISTTGEGIYREKGSRFLAWAIHIRSEDEVKEHIRNFRTVHPDAVHVCSAYLLKKDKGEGRSSDDGEPSGTAGRPMLNQIYSSGLENILVVAVRYYGGIKLGTGGLINAYKTVAKEAISSAEITTVELSQTLNIKFPFSLEGKVNSLLKKYKLETGNKQYETNCQMEIHIPLSVWNNAYEELMSVHGLEIMETEA